MEAVPPFASRQTRGCQDHLRSRVVDFRFFDLLWTIPDQPPATAGGSDKTEPARSFRSGRTRTLEKAKQMTRLAFSQINLDREMENAGRCGSCECGTIW